MLTYDHRAGQSVQKQDWGLSPGLHPLASEASVSLLIKWRQRSGSTESSRGCSMFLLRVLLRHWCDFFFFLTMNSSQGGRVVVVLKSMDSGASLPVQVGS